MFDLQAGDAATQNQPINWLADDDAVAFDRPSDESRVTPPSGEPTGMVQEHEIVP